MKQINPDCIDTTSKSDVAKLKREYNLEDDADAIQKMYDDAGWVVTDIDSHQAYLEIEKDELYKFREKRGDWETGYHMVEEEMRVSEIEEIELLKAVEDMGYTEKDFIKWMKEDVPMVLECYFEMY